MEVSILEVSKTEVSILEVSNSESEWTSILTIKDIFDFTPDIDIAECAYRDKTGSNVIERTKENCTFFNITKYVRQYICYRIKPQENNNMRFGAIYSSLYYERMLFEISCSGRLSRSTKSRVTLTGTTYPYMSRKYTPCYYKNCR